MAKHYDVAIIGAGTAGLTARTEVAKRTENYVVIDGGTLGTTCARVGCMPSKALITVANAFYEQSKLTDFGVKTGTSLKPNNTAVMTHVRHLRDELSDGVKKGMEEWKEKLVQKQARFLDSNTLDIGDGTIKAEKIIIATGAESIIPEKWNRYDPYLLDTNRFFDLKNLPEKISIFGLGPVGIEIGQALSRLGISVTAVNRSSHIGGLTDPMLQKIANRLFSKEFRIYQGNARIEGVSKNGLSVGCDDDRWSADKVFLSIGRAPAIRQLGLENIGADLKEDGIPVFDKSTLQLKNLPVFIAGDANGFSPLLHEAADEGRIAGSNAVAEETACYQRRVPLRITFSSPNIAVAGKSWKELSDSGTEFVIGIADFETSNRARMGRNNKGAARIYADKEDGTILGSEMIAPAGEHLAHLMAWAISSNMSARKILTMPFYHPVIEESLRPAFRDIVKQIRSDKPDFEMFRCQDTPVC